MTSSLAIVPAVRVRRLAPSAAFAAIAAALAAFFAAAGASSPLLPIYEAHWGFPSWMLTLAFGVYALALLAALLVVGSLSDHVGRRPLLIGALAVELVSMVMFLIAPSILWILLARAVQGFATGAATSSFSAAIVELAPESRKRLGSVIGSVAPAAGLGIGALFSGAVATVSGTAEAVVWGVLVAIMAVALVLAVLTPETSSRRAGAVRSLIPRVSVPRRDRVAFALSVPGEVAAWMLSALFLGLVPTVLRAVFDVQSPLISGLAAAAALGSGALVSWLAAPVPARRLMLAGAGAVTLGAALFVGSVVLTALPLLWVGAVLGGAGLGATLSGTIRSLIPGAEAHQRAGLFAAIFLVAYLAFGIPAIIAGVFLSTAGVTATVVVYGIVIAAFAALGLATQAVIRRR